MKKTYLTPKSDFVALNVTGDILDQYMGNSNGATMGGDNDTPDDPEIQGAKGGFFAGEGELPKYDVWQD